MWPCTLRISVGLLFGLLSLGCTHTQLRHNTVRQAQTLSEIYEQQVLDNLAMFCVNPHAVPYFAYPKDGTGTVTDNGALTGSPFRKFRSVVGLNLSRDMQEQWGLTPVAEPDKLSRMRCAYQRAVGAATDGCMECCELEKEWNDKPDLTFQVYDPVLTKEAMVNPKTGEKYDVEETHRIYRDEDGTHYEIDAQGFVTIPQFDCNGPCTVHCGWLCSGSWHEVPKDCCGLVGHYCGMYVWAEPCYRDHLARLTLKILDYAVNDPPKKAPLMKEVTFQIDRHGHITDNKDAVAGSVKTIVGINDPVNSAINGDALWKKQLLKEEEQQAKKARQAVFEEAQELGKRGNISMQNIGKPGFMEQLESELANSKLSTMQAQQLISLVKQLNQPAADNEQSTGVSRSAVAPAVPQGISIPKQPTLRPVDGGLNKLQIQRDLRSIELR